MHVLIFDEGGRVWQRGGGEGEHPLGSHSLLAASDSYIHPQELCTYELIIEGEG